MTKRIFIVSIILTIALMIGVSPALAATITVSASAVGGNSDNPIGRCTLREAIQSANADSAVVAAATGCTQGSGADTIVLPVASTITIDGLILGDLDVTSTISITGNGAIVQASGTLGLIGVRVFDVAGGSLTLNSMTVQNGGSLVGGLDGGGCIKAVNSTLSLNSVTVQGCIATLGAGVYGINSTVSISGGTITNNDAIGSGGGVYVAGTLTMNGANVTNNDAGIAALATGGGITYIGTALSITGGNITGNFAQSLTLLNAGGGIYVDGGGTISGTNISTNRVNGTLLGSGGGGIYKTGGGTLSVSGVAIESNRVFEILAIDADGGGVYRANGNMSITGSRIQHNRVPSTIFSNGGAYYSANIFGTDSITNSCIVDNTDFAVVNDLAGVGMTATDNWWGSSWGPNIPLEGSNTGSGTSTGDSIIGNGTITGFANYVNVDDGTDGIDYGTESGNPVPSGGNWKFSAPSGCSTCTSVSSIGGARNCA